MSCVTLQVGQCGNQFGEALFSTLHEQLKAGPKHDVFFDEQNMARAVLLDMEPKVVERCISRNSEWLYRPESAYWKQSGSGNNWAFGFNEYGPKSHDPVLEALRRQIELCDRLDSLIILKSTAGGTGSGVGAYFSHELKDIFKAPLVSVEMWPFRSGEVCVQSYNTLLSLAASHDSADLVVIFENSDVSQIARDRLGILKPSFSTLNDIAATHLSHQISGGSVSTMVNHLSSHPHYKIGTVRFVPQTSAKNFSTDDWSSLTKSLLRMQRSGVVIDQVNSKSLQINQVFTSQLCLRGKDSSNTSLQGFRENAGYWNRITDPLRVVASSEKFLGFDKTASTLSVDQTCAAGMQRAVQHAYQMSQKRAFVHQYESFGISSQCLLENIRNIEELVHRYTRAT